MDKASKVAASGGWIAYALMTPPFAGSGHLTDEGSVDLLMRGPQISCQGTVFDDSGQVIKVAVGGDEIGEPVPALACLQVLVDLPG